MKAVANLMNLKSMEGKRTILRNLSRILDIRIIYIDIDKGILLFLYANPIAVQKVRQELLRLGYPIQSFQGPNPDASYRIFRGNSTEMASV